MRIGILQCGHTPEEVAATHGDFDAMFHRLLAGHGLTFETWNVVDMAFPAGPDAAEGWLVTGSRHGAYEDHAFIPPLEDLIRAIHASGRRMVGICFGHQIIAQALGGRVEKFSGGWAVGRHGYEIEGVGPMALNAFHQDQVVQVPGGATVVGTSPFCANAALVYGDGIFTVQPHPEITNDVLTSYLAAPRVRDAVPTDKLTVAAAENTAPTDGDTVGQMLARFLKTGVPT